MVINMAIPTKEEYEEAMQNVIYLKDWIARENKRRDGLINQLCDSQKLLEEYKEALDYQKDIVMKYELYYELSSHYE